VRYAANGFWRVLPALLIDLAFTGRLPAMFQPENFWRADRDAVRISANCGIASVLTKYDPAIAPVLRLPGRRTTVSTG
jgi:hypothetical protein